MLNNQSTNIEHIIAKLDNDFNIDHSDYIPRVAAWVIEALSILKCNITETKKIKIKVNDRIACFDGIDTKHMKVYDSNGCELESMEDITKNAGSCSKCDSSTGEDTQSNMIGRDEQIAIPIDSSKYPTEYVTTSRLKAIKGINNNRYYVLLSNNKLELNYDADCIFIKYKGVKTYYSDMYGCELPVIPNNGLLIEAIGYYCMYKILCRGHKHPVMNLNASQYGTNPYFMWNQLKDQAKRSVIIDEQGDVIDDGGLWRNSFFNFTFNPKG